MDSISQFALGAAIGVAVMGRRTAPWKAALWGGACGTLPDLDALISYGDPVTDMTRHRGETHALFWQTIAAAPIAAAIAFADRATIAPQLAPKGSWTGARDALRPGDRAGWRARFPSWLLAVWLILVTHALLDATTVYGTQLALPFADHPFSLGSIFIIDPLYTLPLIVGLLVALRARGSPRLGWNIAGLVVSTVYLGWSIGVQRHVSEIVDTQIAAQPGAPARHVLVTPSPLNTILWRVLVMREFSYDEGFYSLLDGDRPIRFDTYPRDRDLYEQVRDIPAVARIAWFTRGFYRVDERDGLVRITDLRMGQEPFYVFSFGVARRTSTPEAIPPVAAGGREGLDLAASFSWLLRRAAGAQIDPPR